MAGWPQKLVIATGLIAGLGLMALGMKEPQADRLWAPEFERSARFGQAAPARYTLENIRDFQYSDTQITDRAWRSLPVDAGSIVETWFLVEPFPASGLFAHTFVTFIFETTDGARTAVSISVEARRERDEPYSPLRGLLRDFELSYVWAHERDLMTRIAVLLGHPLYAYKFNDEHGAAGKIFRHFVARTNDIRENPRFYNTIASNCTNELYKAVNDAFPGTFPENTAWFMTGLSARSLHAGGYLGDPGIPFEAIRDRAEITRFVKAHAALPPDAFAAAWRADYQRAQEK